MNSHNNDGLWLPPGSVVDWGKLGRQVERAGFKVDVRHDAGERVVEVRFRPITDRTRQIVRRESDGGDGMIVAATYRIGDNWGECVIECVNKGLADLEQVL